MSSYPGQPVTSSTASQVSWLAGTTAPMRHKRTAHDTRPSRDHDIAGALCFPNVDSLPLLRRIEVRGTLVDGSKHIAQLAAPAGSLEATTVDAIWSHLARAFPTT